MHYYTHALRVAMLLLLVVGLAVLAVGILFTIESNVADHNAALERAMCAEAAPADRDDECYPYTYRSL